MCMCLCMNKKELDGLETKAEWLKAVQVSDQMFLCYWGLVPFAG